MAIAFASVYFDINKRRIYEVPPGAGFTTDGNGFRIYDSGPTAYEQTVLDVQQAIWSRGVDWWAAGHDYADFPLVRSGGAFRGFDAYGGEKYATNDYTLRYDADGWLFVLADYDHECQFIGNLSSDDANGIMFDSSRLTSIAIPRQIGADALITYLASGSGANPWELLVPGTPTAGSFGELVKAMGISVDFLKEMEGGRWLIDSAANQMIFFGEDNVTEIARFNLLDGAGSPTSNNPMERVRV